MPSPLGSRDPSAPPSRLATTTRVLIVAVLVALSGAALQAQDQTLQPDAENNPTDVFNDACTTACSAAACDDDVDEGQLAADGLEVSTTTLNASILFDFPLPSANPSTTANAQAMDIVMSRCDDDASCTERAGGSDPPFSAWITCNGADITQIFNADAITTTDQLKTATFTFPGACAADGSDLGVRIELGRSGGSPANRNHACIEAVDWDVTHAAAGETLTVTQTNVASADVVQGTTDKLLQVLDLSSDGSTTLTDLTVTQLGTALDADTPAVRLWHDVDNSDSLTGGDTQLDVDGDFTGNGSTVSFTGLGFPVSSAEAEKLLVTVDIAGAGSSTEGNTIGSSTTAMVVSDGDTISGLPQAGNAHTITDSGDVLTVGQTLTGGGNVDQGTSDLVVQVLDLTADNDSVTLTQLVASQLGTAVDADTTAARLWHDVNNDNALDGGDTQLGADGDFTGPGSTVTFTGFSFPVDSATAEKLLITVDVAVGATVGNTVASSVNTTTGVTVSAPDTVANSGVLSGDLFTIQAGGANDTLTVSQTNVPSADVVQGTSDKLLQVLDLSIDNTGNGTTTLTSLTVTQLGTAVDADSTAVRLWHDANNSDTLDGGDTQLGADGDFTGNGSTVIFTALGFPVNNGTPEKLLVTADVAAAGGSTEGNTIGSSTTAMTLSDSDTIAGLPQAGNTHTITDSGDVLTVGQTATGGGNVNQGTSNLVVQVLDLTANNDSVTLTQLVASQLGTAVDADTTAARLWHDVDNDGVYDNGTDTQLGGDGDFTGPGSTVTFTSFSFPVDSATAERVLVTVDVAAGATAGNTVASSVSTVTGVTVSAPDTVANTGILSGDLFTIQAATGDSLSASDNTPIRALDPAVGETGLVMQRFRVDSDTAGDGVIELTLLRVDEQGTAQTADIATVSVYIDVDLDFDGAVQIGSVAYGADPQDVALTGGTPDDRTVTNPSPKYLWIVYDLAGGATAGRTLQSRVTEIEVAGVDTGLTGQALDSNLLTIIEAAQDNTTVSGSEAFVSSCSTPSAIIPTGQITVISRFTGDANDDGSVQVVWDTDNDPGNGGTIGCTQVTGASPRQCLVTGLEASSDAGSNYWIEVTFADGDGVGGGTNPETLGGGGGFNIPDCAGDTAAPTVLLLSPWRDAIIGGTERIKVQVYEDSADGSGLAATDPVQWAVDGGALSATGVTDNTVPTGNYDCGTDCKIYEFDLDTTTVNGGLTDDRHRLVIQVTDAASPTNVARIEQAFRVRNLGTTPGGSGQLLRRSPGSRLCVDCHDLPTHSSQSTGTDYGNWAMACNDCHTPHGTENVFLVRQEVRTPNSGRLDVRFEIARDDVGAGAVQDSTAAGDASYANEDADTDTGTTPAHGPCQVCHTKTQDGGTARWQNTTAGGNSDNHYDFGRPTQTCTNCHTHSSGFSPVGGGACSGCHFGPDRFADTRRDVQADFTRQSHHIQVGGGSGNPGELTDHDCVVCHAEGTVNAQGETETTSDFHNDNDCGGNPCIDLKDVDNWIDADPLASPVFRYDKQDLIDRLSGGVPGDTPGNWGSGDIDWEDETSNNLDPFCLSCHDTNGALSSYSKEDDGGGGVWGSALDPFGDDGVPGDGIVITNTYDLLDRTRVVDIDSMVTGASDLDGDSRDDPPDGVYARHAIRADLAAAIGAPSRYGSNQIPSANWTSTTWNDQAVMGCADCHTVDGANAANGNAHGSPSEYLLKDAFGKANEGTFDNYNDTAETGGYVCWRCHTQSVYSDGNPAHSGSGSNFEDTVLETGTARITAAAKGYGTIFGMACMSCHGSAPASVGTFQNPGTPEGPEKGFGRIHGTSQKFGTGQNGGVGTRDAYRFQNGGGLRYYDPNGWNTATATCYTLNGDTDQWSGCEQHNKANGQSYTREFTRPRDY